MKRVFFCSTTVAIALITLVWVGLAIAAPTKTPPVTLGPKTLTGDGTPPTAYEFFLQPGSSWKGDIGGIAAGTTYSLVVTHIDVTGVTGPAGRQVYFNLQDAESGSTFKHLGISARLQDAGAGGRALLQCYQNFTSDGLSSHGFNAGVLTESDFSLRFDFTKAAPGNVWTVTPYYRLSGGVWTLFFDGAFNGTVAFDFLGGKLAACFDGGADGTVSFSNYYLAAPASKTYIDDAWVGYGDETAVQFPGETAYRTVGVDAFDTIQEGVNAVTSGGNVYVADGSYTEQVEIAKNAVLDGAGVGTVIVSPNVLTKYFMTIVKNYPIVYIHNATVTVRDLVVDGAGKGNANYRFSGVAYRNAGGTVSNCTIKNVKDTPLSGGQHGVALYAYNDDGVSRSLAVWDNVIFDFQKNAMALNAGTTTPLAVDVRRNIVTGAGATGVTAQNGIQVWADVGTGALVENQVSGIGYTGSSTVASSFLNYYTDLNFTGNTVTNGHVGIYNYGGAGDMTGNTLTISKIGSYCYGIIATDPPGIKASPIDEELLGQPGLQRLSAPAGALTVLDVDITDNTVAFGGTDTSGTCGIYADAGYGPDNIDLDIADNDVSGFDVGVGIYKCTSGCGAGAFTSAKANYNSLTGNRSYGMESDVDYLTVDGTYNWWGAASGPYHATLNPSGTGNAVSNNVLFSPWLGSENEVAVVPSNTLTNCLTPKTVTFHIDQSGVPEEVGGYEVKFQISPSVVTVSNVGTDITEGGFLSSVGGTSFYALSNGSGAYTVSCAILGQGAGATGHGDLFSVVLTPVAQGTSAITITSIKLRTPANEQLPSSSVGGSIQVDCTYPTMEAIAEAQGGWYNSAPMFSNFGFDDDVNLDRAEYKVDIGGSWTLHFSGIDAASWDSDGWVLPGFTGLSEGSHTVYFRVKDDAGNWNGEGGSQPNSYSWQFNKDTTPPAPPTNFVARPGHNKTHLTWTNPTGDPTFVGVEVRDSAWSGYPEYLPPAPSYPADHTRGAFVALVAGQSYDDNPRTPRDVYYYAAFSKDLAGNYSSYSSGAVDRATSYWLGDLDSDGYVNVSDVVIFSSAFGTSEGGGSGWNNVCDFGPTDDWSSKGIPQPDNTVDFEDLMIFSMNWGNVLPSGMGRILASVASEDLGSLVRLDVVWLSDDEISIILSNAASTLKGVHIVVDIVGAELAAVERGAMFAGNSQLFFGTVGGGSTADVSLAALGDGVPVAGSGEVVRLRLKAGTGGPAVLMFRAIDLRNLVNEKSQLILGGRHEAPFVPVVTALGQNYPNPFNPLTIVTYDLAKAGRVTVQVFDVSGRLVRTLVDESKAAGRYSAEWNGRDEAGVALPSGVYFCSMQTPGFSASQKMIMVR